MYQKLKLSEIVLPKEYPVQDLVNDLKFEFIGLYKLNVRTENGKTIITFSDRKHSKAAVLDFIENKYDSSLGLEKKVIEMAKITSNKLGLNILTIQYKLSLFNALLRENINNHLHELEQAAKLNVKSDRELKYRKLLLANLKREGKL